MSVHSAFATAQNEGSQIAKLCTYVTFVHLQACVTRDINLFCQRLVHNIVPKLRLCQSKGSGGGKWNMKRSPAQPVIKETWTLEFSRGIKVTKVTFRSS